MNEIQIYQDVISAFGIKHQKKKATEELAELFIALVKDMPDEHVAQEVADVEIMCAQLRLILPSGMVESAKNEKLKRLVRYIEEKISGVSVPATVRGYWHC